MVSRTISSDDFQNLSTGKKIRILQSSLESDPKAAMNAAWQWRQKHLLEALVAQFFLAKSLVASVGHGLADKEAWRCIALADGINDSEDFVDSGKTIRLPKSFAEIFPHLIDDASRFWNLSQNRQKSLLPSFTLQVTGNDLSNRWVLVEKQSGIDHWPISFRRKLFPEDETREQTISREEIAAIVIRLCGGKSLRRMNRTAKVVTLGSCFATNLNNSLISKGIASTTLNIDEAINTTAANRLFLDQCLNGVNHPELESVINGRDLTGLRELLVNADLIVLTVGVAPVMEWVDTGKLCIVDKYRPLLEEKRISQRFTTSEENCQNIVNIVNMLKSQNPRAQICVTLSPVPLMAAVGDTSVVERDALSKSILKVAIEEARKESDFFYWPAFEVVKWITPHIPLDAEYQAYGSDDLNSRHVSRWLIDVIVQEFIDAMFED